MLARAIVNRRSPPPLRGDAYDCLKLWAAADPDTAPPGSVARRAHPDTIAAARREMEEARAAADAVIALILEEAAKVAECFSDPNPYPTIQQAIANRIRAMKEG